ncbi:MAG: response regulator [Verrucomicrobiales bacterium]|nr:response regulator [Verrucomicrobiales bacterium]
MEARMPTHPHHSIPSDLPPANCFTVLVIDDMLPNRVLLRKFLKTAGYAVIEATNGIEALELLRNQQLLPDLIITDVEMPVMDGITMVEQIRYLDSGIASVPVVVASGNPDEEMKKRSLEVGSDVFLTKPFDFKVLRKEIATLLRARRKVSRANFSVVPPLSPNRVDSEIPTKTGS